MNRAEVLTLLQDILDDAKTAVLATTDEDGCPRTRWVSPALLKGRPESIFMITSPRFAKTNQIERNPRVEWLFQTRALTRIVNIRGQMRILTNAAIRSEVLEALAPGLRTFWKLNKDEPDLVVLECTIDEATVFLPIDGTRETISFDGEKSDGK